jgi:hypothetical protein
MKPFVKAHVPKSETDALRADLLKKPVAFFEKILGPEPPRSEIEKFVEETLTQANDCVRWNNDKYQVSIFDAETTDGFPAMWHLSIKRHDRYPVFNWRDIQTLKNELIGPENEAVQLFPAESRLVDGANQYHLFVLKDPTIKFPFGFWSRVVTEESIGKSKNRPFSPGNEERETSAPPAEANP